MAASNPKADALGQREGIATVVEPIKAFGAAAGFAVGFLAAWRSGADLPAAAMHGLLGAGLLWALAWWAGLFLVREMMLRNVEEQRRLYTERVNEINAQVSAVRDQKGPAANELQPLAPVPRASLKAPGS
jgi:hypothetical protein